MMFLNRTESSNLPIQSAQNFSRPFREFLLSQRLLAVQPNASLIQPEQLEKLNPQIALFLKNLNLFDDERAVNQSIAGAYIQSSLPESYGPVVTNLDSVVKVYKDVPLEVAIFMFGYIMPLLLIITILFNSMIVIVLSQKHMRTPTNMVLLVMAIFDMMTLMFPAPWYFYAYFLGRYHYLPNPRIFCFLFHYMNEVLPAFFHTTSIWLTLLLAGQRYIYVCHPIMARDWCTISKVSKAILLLALLAFAHQFTRFFDRNFQDVQYQTIDGKLFDACLFSTAAWVSDVVGENLYFTSYYGFRIFFVHLFPCSALVILNLLLFRTLAMARQNRKKLFSRCTAPSAPSAATNNKPTTLINRPNEEHRINNGNEFKTKGLGKRNLRSKLSNAFTTIILSNTSLSNAPKLNGSATNGREEATSSMPLTEETLPENSGGHRPNHLLNGQSPDINYPNQPSERTNQLIAHHISANKTSSSSSIHSYTTTSNQISSMSPSSVYRLQSAASLTTNGQTAVNAAIITNSAMTANGMTNVICTNPGFNLPVNSAAINKAVNTPTSAAPSLSLPGAYPASSNCKLNSDPNSKPANESNLVNGNINYSLNDNVEHSLIDNLVSNQDSAENGQSESNTKGNSPDRGLIANKSDIKSELNTQEHKAGNQLNLSANQLRNFNTTEKLSVNKPQISENRSSSASYTSSAGAVQKSASCKKMNTLECRRQRDNQCTTLMLVVIVSVFLLTEIPLAITTLLHVTQNILDISFANYKTLNSTILFTNFFIMLSYPVNFAIYCGMSRQFRETFKTLILNRIFCRKTNKKNGRYTTTTNATYSNYEAPCSRQFRHGSVTNQLIANPANVLQIKGRRPTSQQPSDNSTSNQMNNDQLEDESTSQSRQERNSDPERPNVGKEPTDDAGREETRRARKERQSNEDRRIRFKTSSFELENCDLNNNRTPDEDVENNPIYSNQFEDDNDQLNRYGDRPPYIETNL